MIDWHSHVLPKMDDGSRSVSESEALLKELKAQGVNTVIATPHFYANEESLESFMNRRQKTFGELSQSLSDDLPKVLLGAEVCYYSGISQLENLECLKIENSNLLLLEMPFSRWTEYTVRELLELSASGRFTIVLAHIDRYISMQDSSIWDRLYENGILMQANASFFTEFFKKKKALYFLQNNRIHFIGSDCHNMTARPPKLKLAYDYVSHKLGNDILTEINEFGKALLG